MQKKGHTAGLASKELEIGWRRPGEDEVVEVAHSSLAMARSVKGTADDERLERSPDKQPVSSKWCIWKGWMYGRRLGH